MKETDLYKPVKELLIRCGFEVFSEVRKCDVVARKGDETIIVELKLRPNLPLLVQAVDRQRLVDAVFVALPEIMNRTRRGFPRGTVRLLRLLRIGLILVDSSSTPWTARIMFNPTPYKPRANKRGRSLLLKEIDSRSGDYNVGGSVKTKIMTAYREKSLYIAVCLDRLGSLTTKQIRELKADTNSTRILYNNHYGWFKRLGKAYYEISDKGKKELDKYPKLVKKLKSKLLENTDKTE